MKIVGFSKDNCKDFACGFEEYYCIVKGYCDSSKDYMAIISMDHMCTYNKVRGNLMYVLGNPISINNNTIHLTLLYCLTNKMSTLSVTRFSYTNTARRLTYQNVIGRRHCLAAARLVRL